MREWVVEYMEWLLGLSKNMQSNKQTFHRYNVTAIQAYPKHFMDLLQQISADGINFITILPNLI